MKEIIRKKNLFKRAEIIQAIRQFFHNQEFLEVETPQLLPTNAPEEYIDPISCGMNYLQTSPEICMKRLLCKGYDRIFQISHCWRSGERGSKHLPEFTMLEWYRAGADYEDLIADCQNLLYYLEPFRSKESEICFNNEFKRMTVRDAYKIFSSKSMEEAVEDDSFDQIMVSEIEPFIPPDAPFILHDYPAKKAALAQLKESDPTVAERFELYLGGIELANGFTELNNSDEQRKRFIVANKLRKSLGSNEIPLPDKFLNELESMPNSAGIALGIDRLVMLATGSTAIDEVVAFTPEEL